ncbi:hypothetical protein AOLI_G00325640 [Acnodon oligacanthus]
MVSGYISGFSCGSSPRLAARQISYTGHRWVSSEEQEPCFYRAGSGGDERRRTGGSRGGGLRENRSPRGEKTTRFTVTKFPLCYRHHSAGGRLHPCPRVPAAAVPHPSGCAGAEFELQLLPENVCSAVSTKTRRRCWDFTTRTCGLLGGCSSAWKVSPRRQVLSCFRFWLCVPRGTFSRGSFGSSAAGLREASVVGSEVARLARMAGSGSG